MKQKLTESKLRSLIREEIDSLEPKYKKDNQKYLPASFIRDVVSRAFEEAEHKNFGDGSSLSDQKTSDNVAKYFESQIRKLSPDLKLTVKGLGEWEGVRGYHKYKLDYKGKTFPYFYLGWSKGTSTPTIYKGTAQRLEKL